MNRIVLLVTIIFCGCLSLHSQDKKAIKFSKTITAKDLKSYLSVLASDSLEGRETGEKGQKLAAEFIKKHFSTIGLESPVETKNEKSYFQKYLVKKVSYRDSYLKKEDEKKINGKDFIYYSKSETAGEEYVDIVFIGETMDSPSLEKLELSNKWVAVYTENMINWKSMFNQFEKQDIAGVMLFVEDTTGYNFVMDRFSRDLSKSSMGLEIKKSKNKVVVGNPDLAGWIFGMPYEKLKREGVGTSSKLIFMADMLIDELYAENVLGYLKGSEKPDEVLVITAHYDHIGISENGEINNGADDDASGTSSVMEIAQAFMEAANKGYRPKRSILFMTVSGEEKGLLGSKYYTQNPVFPMKNTVANLNIDMVGRVDDAHKDNPKYIYLIGSDKLSQDLHELSEQVNNTYTQLELDYTYNDENDPNRYYYRSDHYNFAVKNVPIIFYFNGTHPDYHKPTDTIEKIQFDKMELITRLIFFTAWEIANREDRIKVD